MISDLDENEESEKAVENFGLRDINDLDGPSDMHGETSDGSFGNHFHKNEEVSVPPINSDYESQHK